MDISALLLPGAQKLAGAMLSDAWTTTRDAVARHWGRGSSKATAEAMADLEGSRTQALALFPASDPDQQILFQAFVAGYLAALARTDPERLDVLAEPLPAVTADNVMSGRADKVVQIAGDVSGGVHM